MINLRRFNPNIGTDNGIDLDARTPRRRRRILHGLGEVASTVLLFLILQSGLCRPIRCRPARWRRRSWRGTICWRTS